MASLQLEDTPVFGEPLFQMIVESLPAPKPSAPT